MSTWHVGIWSQCGVLQGGACGLGVHGDAVDKVILAVGRMMAKPSGALGMAVDDPHLVQHQTPLSMTIAAQKYAMKLPS